jgi:ABC-type branched-subunit amino acid transport system ATPase component
VLDQGQIIAIGSATEIQANEKVQQAYLGQFMKPTSHLAGAE